MRTSYIAVFDQAVIRAGIYRILGQRFLGTYGNLLKLVHISYINTDLGKLIEKA